MIPQLDVVQIWNQSEITIHLCRVFTESYSLGEREKLLTAFCKYQSSQNKHDDSDPNHWDIALDLSGLDFYAAASGSHVTMGLAHVAGKTSFGLISA